MTPLGALGPIPRRFLQESSRGRAEIEAIGFQSDRGGVAWALLGLGLPPVQMDWLPLRLFAAVLHSRALVATGSPQSGTADDAEGADKGPVPDDRNDRQREVRLVASIGVLRIQTKRCPIRTRRRRHDGPVRGADAGAFIGCLGLVSARSVTSAVKRSASAQAEVCAAGERGGRRRGRRRGRPAWSLRSSRCPAGPDG